MNKDIRLSVGFFDNPKTVKLQRRCGVEGIISLQKLWIWTAMNKPNGDLSGMDSEDIEIAAKWEGEPGLFFSSASGSFIDIDGDKIKLHDWEENNSWAAGAEDRADKGRFNRLKSTFPQAYEILANSGFTSLSKEDYTLISTSKDQTRTAQGLLKCALSDPTSPGPTPAPAPAPKPKPKSKHLSSEALRLSTLLADKILENNPSHRDLSNGKRDKAINRWGADIDKMIRLDNRPEIEIESVITWCQENSFWRKNILSGEKLRAQYDKLILEVNDQRGKTSDAKYQRLQEKYGNP